jgi:hypothetical protein
MHLAVFARRGEIGDAAQGARMKQARADREVIQQRIQAISTGLSQLILHIKLSRL